MSIIKYGALGAAAVVGIILLLYIAATCLKVSSGVGSQRSARKNTAIDG